MWRKQVWPRLVSLHKNLFSNKARLLATSVACMHNPSWLSCLLRRFRPWSALRERRLSPLPSSVNPFADKESSYCPPGYVLDYRKCICIGVLWNLVLFILLTPYFQKWFLSEHISYKHSRVCIPVLQKFQLGFCFPSPSSCYFLKASKKTKKKKNSWVYGHIFPAELFSYWFLRIAFKILTLSFVNVPIIYLRFLPFNFLHE